MLVTAVFEARSFAINQRGGMIEGSISRVMYCDHIEVGSHPHIYITHTILPSVNHMPPQSCLHCGCSFWKMFKFCAVSVCTKSYFTVLIFW